MICQLEFWASAAPITGAVTGRPTNLPSGKNRSVWFGGDDETALIRVHVWAMSFGWVPLWCGRIGGLKNPIPIANQAQGIQISYQAAPGSLPVTATFWGER